jgi:hypothetical protein
MFGNCKVIAMLDRDASKRLKKPAEKKSSP